MQLGCHVLKCQASKSNSFELIFELEYKIACISGRSPECSDCTLRKIDFFFVVEILIKQSKRRFY